MGPEAEVFWTDSGADDLRWHVKSDCHGLRMARRPPRPHTGCAVCTKDVYFLKHVDGEPAPQ
eukprot:8087527-Alexandrium_andersonii.AAC.1